MNTRRALLAGLEVVLAYAIGISLGLWLTGCIVVQAPPPKPKPPKVCTDQWNGPQDYSKTPVRDR